MQFYVVYRDMLQTVWSILDRLGIQDNVTCNQERLEKIPLAWRQLFLESNATTCPIRLAQFHINYYTKMQQFIQTLPFEVPYIHYEDFNGSDERQSNTVLHLCKQLAQDRHFPHLTCQGRVRVKRKQQQGRGTNRGKALMEIWPPELIAELEQMD